MFQACPCQGFPVVKKSTWNLPGTVSCPTYSSIVTCPRPGFPELSEVGIYKRKISRKKGRAEDFLIDVALTLLAREVRKFFLIATPNFLLFGEALRIRCGARPI